MGEVRSIKQVRRGEIYLVSFDPTVGREIQKTRPALVVQNDVSNRYSPITIVAPITSTLTGRLYPTEVLLQAHEGGLDVDSRVLLNQLRAVDKQRLVRRLGRVSAATLHEVDRSLAIT